MVAYKVLRRALHEYAIVVKSCQPGPMTSLCSFALIAQKITVIQHLHGFRSVFATPCPGDRELAMRFSSAPLTLTPVCRSQSKRKGEIEYSHFLQPLE